MNIEQLCNAEKRKIDKMDFQIPHIYKKVGIVALVVLTVASILSLLLNSFVSWNTDLLRPTLKPLIIISMLIIAISEEKVEDEMIMKIRHRAFSLSVIWTVIYALTQPLATYGVNLVLNSEKAVYEDIGSFIILWFLLVTYLAYFHLAKRMA
jgi:hypothetical protein